MICDPTLSRLGEFNKARLDVTNLTLWPAMSK
jgi:hypothetical protein